YHTLSILHSFPTRRSSDLYIIDVESLRRHYVKTLLHWYDNFNEAEEAVREMFDERFVRMWRLYLVASAANFNIGGIVLHQIVFRSEEHTSELQSRFDLVCR